MTAGKQVLIAEPHFALQPLIHPALRRCVGGVGERWAGLVPSVERGLRRV